MKATAEGQPTVGKKPESKTVSLRTETTYKADEADEVAQDTKVQGSATEVNAEVVQLQFAFLSGEIPGKKCLAEVSRRHSSGATSRGRVIVR